MNSVIQYLIKQVGNALSKQHPQSTATGASGDTGTLFGHIINAVMFVEKTATDPNIAGKDKQAMVFASLKTLGIELVGFLGNALLEMAVVYAKLELGKLKV